MSHMTLPSGENFGKLITADDVLAWIFFLMNKMLVFLPGPSENILLLTYQGCLRSQLFNWFWNIKMVASGLLHIRFHKLFVIMSLLCQLTLPGELTWKQFGLPLLHLEN